MLVVVVYDIPDNKRRTKLSNFLEGHGRRIQYSVFECFMSLKEMKMLWEEVKTRVEPTEDNVRFYWISQESVYRTLAIGSDPPKPPPQFYVL